MGGLLGGEQIGDRRQSLPRRPEAPRRVRPIQKGLTSNLLKKYRSLENREGRVAARSFILEGPKAVRHVLDHHTDELIEIITSEPTHPPFGAVPVRVVSRKQFRSLSQAQSPQGTLAVVRLPTEIYSDGLPGRIGNRLLLLEDIQDPGNVGTLIRTAAAFDFSGIILTEKCADPFSPKCVQSTAGTVLSVWMRRTPHYGRLIRKLQEAGYFLITADVRAGSQPPPAKNRENLIVALANEAAGPSRWLIDASGLRFRIPINSLKAESLNVAACGAVCMYLFSRPAPSSPVPHTGGKSRPLRGPANVS